MWTIYWYVNNKYMRNYNKNKESLYLNYWDVNNLYGWTISQKSPVNGFKWVENTSQFSKGFMENYKESSSIGYFIEPDGQYAEKMHKPHNGLPFTNFKYL